MLSRIVTLMSSTAAVYAPSLTLNFLSGQLDSRITFSRGSNATLTDSTGKITYAPNNVITNSVGPNASVGTAVTMIANGAPDGTSGIRLSKTDATTPRYCNWTTSFTVQGDTGYIASAYFKYDGYDTTVSLEYNNVNHWGRAWVASFNVTSSGITANAPSSCTSGVQSVGNGWFRVWAAFTSGTPSAPTSPTILTRITGGSGTSVLVAWGQIEQVTYQTTPGTYNSTSPKNLLGYTQEFDNAAWTKSNAFVQTNLLTYSEAFEITNGNVDWENPSSALAITANSVAAPNGTITADTLAQTAVSAAFVNQQRKTLSANTTYTISTYVRNVDINFVALAIFGAADNAAYAEFNLTTGALSRSGANGTGWAINSTSIQSVGGSWYRISAVITTGSSVSTPRQRIMLTDGTTAFSTSGTVTFTGTSKSAYFWGAQLVQGSTAGDYQRTDAAAAAVQYVAPDGSRTADLMVPTAVSGNHQVAQGVTTTASPFTYSVYAKAGGYDWLALAITDSGSTARIVYFNINTGVTGTVATGVTTSISAAGNGWYRCSATVSAALAGSNTCRIYATNTDGALAFTGNDTSGIYIWGAQLSNSASLNPYVYNPVAAPTSAAYYGPRFDYDPVTLANKGLLIEEQRTNLLVRSEEFDNAAWSKTAATITANATSSPDGTTNADKLVATAVTSGHFVSQPVTITASTNYTVSVYVKAAEYGWAIIYVGTVGVGQYVNLSTGAVGSTFIGVPTSTTVSNAGNGWWRVNMVFNSGVNTSVDVRVYATTADGTSSYLGDGTSGIYIYGAQLEAGAFATSYIPTMASQVTRTADVATMTGTNFYSWYNQSEGTFVVDADSIVNVTNVTVCRAFSAGSGGDALSVFVYDGRWGGSSRVGGVFQADIQPASSYTAGIPAKTSFAYKVNDFAVSVNGITPLTDTSGTVPTVAALNIGSEGAGGALNGHIRTLAYYNTRLPNSQLQTLTAPSLAQTLSLDFINGNYNIGF